MARFVFELEVVLQQREREERRRQQTVAELEVRRLALEQRARDVQGSIRSGADEWRTLLGGGSGGDGLTGGAPAGAAAVVPTGAVRLAARASLHGMVELQRAAIDLAGVHQRLARARGELLRATVARKAVEALRTRRYEAWVMEQKRREDLALDDLTVMRAGAARGDLA